MDDDKKTHAMALAGFFELMAFLALSIAVGMLFGAGYGWLTFAALTLLLAAVIAWNAKRGGRDE